MGADGDEGIDIGDYQEDLALAPPTGLTATPISPTAITVSWNAVAGAAWYVLYKGIGPGTETAYSQISTTSGTISHLVAGTEYCFEVRDVNGSTQISGYSNEVCATTPTSGLTAAPTGVTATAISDSRITVSWNAVSGATVYHVFEAVGSGSFSQVAAVAAPATSITIAGLAAATTYSFYVTAVSAGGESVPSSTATTTTFDLGLEGYWKFDEDTGTSAADASGFGRTATLSSATWTTDRAPVSLTKTKSALLTSSASASLAGTAAVSAFRFAGASFSAALWVKLVDGGDSDFIGVRGAGCGALGWKIGQDSMGLNLSGGGGTANFGVTIATGVWTHVAFSYTAGTPGTLTLYVDGTESAQTTYTAQDPLPATALTFGHVGGCAGGAVAIDEARIYSYALSAAEVAALGEVPPAPTLTVTATSASNEQLSWTAVTGATMYYVYRGTAAGNETFLTTVSGTTFVGQHLSPDTLYSWYVRAEAGGLDSQPSNEVIVSTPDLLPAPTFTVTPAAKGRLDIAWTAVTGAASYKIYQSTDNTTFTQVGALLVPATSFEVANLTSGTTYYYQMLAVDSGGNLGTRSASVSAVAP